MRQTFCEFMDTKKKKNKKITTNERGFFFHSPHSPILYSFEKQTRDNSPFPTLSKRKTKWKFVNKIFTNTFGGIM